MPEPTQTTIYGASEPLSAPERSEEQAAPTRLFTAPQTIRGQLAIPTDKEDLVDSPRDIPEQPRRAPLTGRPTCVPGPYVRGSCARSEERAALRALTSAIR